MFVDLIDTFIKEKYIFSHYIVYKRLLLIVANYIDVLASFKIQLLSKVYHSIDQHYTFMKRRYIIYIFYKNVRER